MLIVCICIIIILFESGSICDESKTLWPLTSPLLILSKPFLLRLFNFLPISLKCSVNCIWLVLKSRPDICFIGMHHYIFRGQFVKYPPPHTETERQLSIITIKLEEIFFKKPSSFTPICALSYLHLKSNGAF